MFTSINHNTMAANTARNLNTHYGNLATSTQRLSSGLRINSAADDAAGLAIRELMRADIAAYNQGIRNANDAISMIQVVDGALGIIDEKLIRMKELAEQAATGTYDSTQRLMIDSEFQAMASEIQRIATATDFNGIKLLNYSSNDITLGNDETIVNTYNNSYSTRKVTGPYPYPDGSGFHSYPCIVTTNTSEDIVEIKTIEYIEKDNAIYKQTTIATEITTNTTDEITHIKSWGYNWPAPLPMVINDAIAIEIYDNNIFDYLPQPTHPVFRTQLPTNTALNFAYSYEPDLNDKNLIHHSEIDSSSMPHRYRFGYDITGDGKEDFAFNIFVDKDIYIDPDDVKKYVPYVDLAYYNYSYTTSSKKNGIKTDLERIEKDVTIHFGPMNDSAEDYYDIEKRDCTLKGLGLEDVRIETQDNAQKALVTINDAIVKKDQARAYYGAMQNRLENTVSNLTCSASYLI